MSGLPGWKFDRTFKPGPTVRVAVLYQQEYPPSAVAASQLLSAIQSANLLIHCTLIELEEQATLVARIPISGVDLF